MSQPLCQLVYRSRSRIAGSPNALAAEIGSILAVSRRNNALAGITGALLYRAGWFVQVLEGPRDALQAAFERISQDARNDDVAQLALEPIAERRFTGWSMGFADAGMAAGFDPARLDATRLGAMLDALRLTDDVALAA